MQARISMRDLTEMHHRHGCLGGTMDDGYPNRVSRQIADQQRTRLQHNPGVKNACSKSNLRP